MKKIVSAVLAALLLASAFTACAPAMVEKPASSADGIAKYTAFLEERLDKMPKELAIATAETSATYGVDMSSFADDGYFIRAESGEVVILGKTDAGLDRAVREYVKNGNENDFFKVYNEGYRVKKLTVAGNDVSEYAIVRDDDADEAQTEASNELAKYIALTCGATLPEYTASEYASATSKPARTIRFTVDYPALGDEAFTIEIGGDANVTISGGRYRGCIYGVYDLLEDIGWRFINDADDSDLIEYLYESERVDLTSALNRTESSPFSYRRVHNGYNGKNRSEKYKDHYYPVYGAYGLTNVACHGLQNWHNDIFYDGYYTGCYESGLQPCVTDLVILEYIEEFVLRRVESLLAAGAIIGKDLVYIDLAHWDCAWDAFCHCRKCSKVIAEEGSTMGPWLQMANRNAQLLKDNGYGDVWVSLLAYMGTEVAPKNTKPLDNVRISYCFYPWPCMNHSLSGEDCDHGNPEIGCQGNKDYHKQFVRWVEVCTNDNLDVWYYPLFCDDSIISGAPILNGMYESFRYLADYGTDGIMALSAPACGASLHSLVTYLCARLAWDPYMEREEYEAYVHEWFMILYGEASEPLYDYYMIMESAGAAKGCFNTLHGGERQVNIARNLYDKVYLSENYNMLLKLFDEAHSLAGTEREEMLVRRYKASLLYTVTGMLYEENYLNGSAEKKAQYTQMYTELVKSMNEFNFLNCNDGQSLPHPTTADEIINPFDWLYGK